jgi:hypothetical protein
MHMKNPAQTGSGFIRFNDLNFHQATFAEYSCPIRLREARYVYVLNETSAYAYKAKREPTPYL